MTTELDIARSIAAGTVPSPTKFLNASFYAMRISGTGTAWRPQHNEFVYRDAEIWLTPEMIERARGLIVIWMHPKSGTLDSEEFIRRVVGAITLAYIRGNELWGIARILDDEAAAMLDGGEYDTSPAVTFEPNSNALIDARGDRLLVEGNPALLDHVAIVPAGVWSKGGMAPEGVEISNQLELAEAA